jgi:hypothetical protein
MKINPLDPTNHDRPLWLVYGVECQPQIVCCKIMMCGEPDDLKPTIWGFSVYKGVPGFRTMGHSLKGWMRNMGKSHGWNMFEFYDLQESALTRLQLLTDPVYHSLIAQKETA